MSTEAPLKQETAIRTIALAGNPNSGKTTLFNAFTKLRQKVGNYPGVTVERKTGTLVLAKDRIVNVIDLPGTYSLSVRSPDEQVARDVLLGLRNDTPKPDIVVCVVDAGNLERNLYLVSQIQDTGVPMIVALNMMDEVAHQGRQIDTAKLSELLGVPVVPTVANRSEGVEELKQLLAQGVETRYKRGWRMAPDLEEELEHLVGLFVKFEGLSRPEAFVEAVGFLSHSKKWESGQKAGWAELNAVQDRLLRKGLRVRTAAIEARYNWIKYILQDCIKDKTKQGANVTERIDAVLTHKFFGWVFFFGIMALMFYTIFTVATYPMEWIDAMFANISQWVKAVLPEGDLRDLLTDGVIAGVGGVVIFLPQILILFFFIGLLQDTGYMARAAFIMDRLMSKAGLHGKSFIPLLSSFACAIPGVMAARSIESPKDRLTTILVAPLMSCSARLPVYTILIAVILPAAVAWQKAGIMLALYLCGILGAFVMAWIFKKTLLRSQAPVFIMELPPYRLPLFKDVLLHMWERARLFLRRAGTVIFALSIILWGLMTYPKTEGDPSMALKQSFAGQAGTFLEPAIKPLGYDWRIGIGLIGSFAAREVFVSTMNIVFNIEEGEATETLQEAFKKATWPDGAPLFTPLVCVSLLVFYVFAMQCISTVAVVRRETNSWGWPLFQIAYMTGLAYVTALAVYQGGRLLGLH